MCLACYAKQGKSEKDKYCKVPLICESKKSETKQKQ